VTAVDIEYGEVDRDDLVREVAAVEFEAIIATRAGDTDTVDDAA
jgi:hypothetical protein